MRNRNDSRLQSPRYVLADFKKETNVSWTKSSAIEDRSAGPSLLRVNAVIRCWNLLTNRRQPFSSPPITWASKCWSAADTRRSLIRFWLVPFLWLVSRLSLRERSAAFGIGSGEMLQQASSLLKNKVIDRLEAFLPPTSFATKNTRRHKKVQALKLRKDKPGARTSELFRGGSSFPAPT